MGSTSDRWVALVRGINVGGRNRLAMADLRDTLTASGFEDVRTYIQSGNAVFSHHDSAESILAEKVSVAIEQRHGLAVAVIVRTLDDIARIAARHPGRSTGVPDKWLHVYLLDRRADSSLTPDPERFAPDRMTLDDREVYATYPAGSGRSKLTTDLIERSFHVVATARNVATLDAVVALGHRDPS